MERLYDENMDLKQKLLEETEDNKELKNKYKVLDINHMEKDFTLQKERKGKCMGWGNGRKSGHH
jgi:hypothetical protein